MLVTWGELNSPWIHGDAAEAGYWSDLFAGAESRLILHGETLYRQGDDPFGVYSVISGRLNVSSLHPDGSEKQLYVAEEGSICGEVEVLSGTPRGATATAIVDTEVQVLSGDSFLSRIMSDVSLMRLVLDYCVRKENMLKYQVTSLSFDSAASRISQLLLSLSYLYGEDDEDGRVLDVRFTKAEMASMAGTSRVTTSNVLMSMEKDGILLRRGGHYVIRDLAALREMAGVISTAEDEGDAEQGS